MGLERISRIAPLAGAGAAWATAAILLALHALAGEIFACGAATTGTMMIPAHRIIATLRGDRAERALLVQALTDLSRKKSLRAAALPRTLAVAASPLSAVRGAAAPGTQ